MSRLGYDTFNAEANADLAPPARTCAATYGHRPVSIDLKTRWMWSPFRIPHSFGIAVLNRTAFSARYVTMIVVRTARADMRIADSAFDVALTVSQSEKSLSP